MPFRCPIMIRSTARLFIFGTRAVNKYFYFSRFPGRMFSSKSKSFQTNEFDDESFESSTGKSTFTIYMNEEIMFPTLRLIDTKGFVGDMSRDEALELAKDRGVDLVLINAGQLPALCKLIPVADHIQDINDKLAKKKDTSNDASQYSFNPAGKIRSMTFSAVEKDFDLLRKVSWTRDFLKKGIRVEIDLQRRNGSANQAAERALRIVSELKDCAKPVGMPVDIAAYARQRIAFKLWPCTPEQAAAFRLPIIQMTHVEDDVSEEKRARMDSTRIRKNKDYRDK